MAILSPQQNSEDANEECEKQRLLCGHVSAPCELPPRSNANADKIGLLLSFALAYVAMSIVDREQRQGKQVARIQSHSCVPGADFLKSLHGQVPIW